MKKPLLLATLSFASLSANTISVASNWAEGFVRPHNPEQYCLVYHGNVSAKSSSLGSLSCKNLAVILPRYHTTKATIKIVGFDVTLHHKNAILSAHSLVLSPKQQRAQAYKDVHIIYTDRRESNGANLTSQGEQALIDLKNHRFTIHSLKSNPVETKVTHSHGKN